MKFKSKKKGQTFFTEAFVWVLGFVIIIFTILILTLTGNEQKEVFDDLPNNLVSPLPSSILHTFLHIELNSSEKEELGYDPSQIIQIKDIMALEVHNDPSLQNFLRDKVEEYETFLFSLDPDLFENYVDFMGGNQRDSRSRTIVPPIQGENLGIIFEYNVASLPNIESVVRVDGYYYAIPLSSNIPRFNVIIIEGYTT